MVAVNYLWNPLNDNVTREINESGSTTAEYTTEPGQFGNLVSQRRDGAPSYFHFDGVGSTLALTNESGTITDTRSYSAFGETTESVGSTTCSFQFIGQKTYYSESITGQYLSRRRPYDPYQARWLSNDPIQFKGDTSNLYRYVRNSPLMANDPSGLIPILQGVIDEANRRRGNGPWDDSAQHCWAACYIAAIYGPIVGTAATVIADLAEVLDPSDDAARDIAAQHFGFVAGSNIGWKLGVWTYVCVSNACDTACTTGV